MKRIVVSSIVVLGIIGGGLFIMDNQITKTPQPNIVQNTVVDEQTPVIEKPEVIAETTLVVDIPVVEIQTETNNIDEFNELCLQYFIIDRGDAFLCGQAQRLRKLNPEKFTSENIISSFERIEQFFSQYNSPMEKATSWREFTW
jgi:hypothetical protein